jgi:hypothetical protein
MKNWNLIATGCNLDIPAADLERLAPPLDAVDTAFRPLVARLADDLDPAPVFRAAEDAE